MKHLLLFFIIAVSLLFASSYGQTSKKNTTVWSKQIYQDNSTPTSLIVNNGMIIAGYTDASSNSHLFFVDDGNGQIMCNKKIDSVRLSPTPMVGGKNSGNFYCGLGDSVIQYDNQGDETYAVKSLESTSAPYTIMGRNDDYYFTNPSGGNVGRLTIYDNSNRLVKSWPTLNKITQKISADTSQIILSSYQYGGDLTNVHSFVASYTFDGQVNWTDSLPDLGGSRAVNCIGEKGNIYFANGNYNYGGNGTKMSWEIIKYSPSGHRLWVYDWDGDNGYRFGNWVHDIIALPDGGCIVAGAATRADAPADDPNQYGATLLALDKDGNISWKLTQDDKSFYSSNFEAIAWDNEHNLVCAHEKMGLGGSNGSYNIGEIFKYSIDGVTAVAPQPINLPRQFVLRQNYPNPFNPSTTIEFDLPHSSLVTLKVYNILGQEVATLINGSEGPAGLNSVKFNAGNLAGGVYLYHLQMNEFGQTKKLILIK